MSLDTFFKPVAAAAGEVKNDTPASPSAPSASPAASPLSPAQRASIEAKKAAAMAKLAATKETAASRKRKSASEAAAEEETKEVAAAAAAAAGDDSAASSDPKRTKLATLTSLVPADWAKVLAPEFTKSYWPQIESFLKQQATAKVQVFPAREHIFRALELCPFDQVKVVIIGQDPYHDVGQAEGLCFSVPPGVKVPSSLQNIYKELGTDLGGAAFKKPSHGNLVKWAQQGILLLNTGLTVKAHEANSHKSVGWSKFTQAVIKAVNKEKKGVVFLLWGKHAQDAGKEVDKSKHHVLATVHPSGLSASRGFFGCKHFSKTNEFLKKDGNTPINWQV